MVCELGMSPFGPVAFRPSAGPWDDDRPLAFSEATARRVDEENPQPRAARLRNGPQLLSRQPNAVAALAEELLEVESLDADAIRALISESEQPLRCRRARRTELGPARPSSRLARPSGSPLLGTLAPLARSLPVPERFLPYSSSHP
jgi:hypothetical protein